MNVSHIFLSYICFSLFSLIACNNQSSLVCSDILISPVDNQILYAGTRSYIPLAVAMNQLEQTEFEIKEAPNFVSYTSTERGRAMLTLDPDSTHIGEYNVSIIVTNGVIQGCLDFEIKVQAIPKDKQVVYCNTGLKTAGDGSFENPYNEVSQFIKENSANRSEIILLLQEGNYGKVILSGNNYEILSAEGNTAVIENLIVENAKNISLKGIVFQPKLDTVLHENYIVHVDSTVSKLRFSNNIVQSTDRTDNWTLDDWNLSAARGIKCLANEVEIINNTVQNVFHGIKTEGNNIEVNYNHVDRFGGDAIRNTGSNNSYNYNYLSNATVDDYYAEGGNHDDLFQSWTFDKAIDNISLTHNVMISCVDTLMPLRAKIVQGLVCFDGFTTNWTIENNVVVTDHPHGIALYGAINCKISNNTVLKNPSDLYQYESAPWIMINTHKDGRKSHDNFVNDNVTSVLNVVEESAVVSDNIMIDSSNYKELTNYNEWDFSIKK